MRSPAIGTSLSTPAICRDRKRGFRAVCTPSCLSPKDQSSFCLSLCYRGTGCDSENARCDSLDELQRSSILSAAPPKDSAGWSCGLGITMQRSDSF